MELELRLLINAFQWFFLIYFVLLHSSYILLNLLSFLNIRHYIPENDVEIMNEVYSDFNPPITIIIPAFNEEKTIAASVLSILQLNYSAFEVIVVNDGSTDKMMEVLDKTFSLSPFPEVYAVTIETEKVVTIYRSREYPNLKVLDKLNGGKADSLNAGINASRYPIFCALDADSVLQKDSLVRAIHPFLEDPDVIASGGTIRIANGCRVEEGFMMDVALPGNFLALIQITEYLRAFLFGRLGWSPLNALLIISGAFGLFKKESVISAGGYMRNTIGEDMELVVRLHKKYRSEGKPYRITFVPDPICWTEAPEDLGTLRRQRVRWQRGLAESLFNNKGLLLSKNGGLVGWLAYPFFLIFEWFGPVVEIAGYMIMGLAFALGILPLQIFLTFLMISIGFGFFISASALLLEVITFRIYKKPSSFFILILAALAENFGYRQLNALWRMEGLLKWAFSREKGWGHIERKGDWSNVT